MKRTLFIFLFNILSCSFIFGQRPGVIFGTVKDKSTNSTLPGANISIEGTAIGTISDVDGKYRLMGVPTGEQTFVISFIGYDKFTQKVTVKSGDNIEVNATLVITSMDLEEIIVTSQMAGQMSAINQQLKSDALVNVVSSDKMKELPDINAAEAIGRLPGISINRNGGEAQTINIRGFGADYTAVTINGIRMPETGTGNRVVNLSTISPELLSHIEVYKSPTADMDGDAIGGIVSLGLRPAAPKPVYQLNVATGLNTLKSNWNYKGNLQLSRRFFNSKFGAILNSSFDYTDRSSQDMSTSYSTFLNDENDKAFGYKILPAEDLVLNDINRRISRYGINIQTDYQYRKGNVKLQGMYNRKNTDVYRTGYNYNGLSKADYALAINENKVDIFQVMLTNEHFLNWLEIDETISMNHTNNNTPYNPSITFSDPYMYKDTLRLINELGDIKEKLDYLKYDHSDATMARMDWELDSAVNRNITAAINFKANFKITSKIGGFIKFGGKIQYDTRSRANSPYYQRYDYNTEQLFAKERWKQLTGKDLLVAPNKTIMASNFDIQDKATPFWNSQYSVRPYFPESILRNWYENMNDSKRPTVDKMHYGYEVEERLYASYVMSKVTIDDWFSLVAGLRYEYSDNYYLGKYSTISGNPPNIAGMVKDTTVTKEYGHVLPSVHLKITPLTWMDLRLSYAKTLKRPNYSEIVPTTRVETDQVALIDLGNGELNEMIAKSYDASVSFYTGKYGLLTFGVFSKEFTDYITNVSYTIMPEEAAAMGLSKNAWEIRNKPINLPDKGYVKGFEVDIQTNFKYLPAPLNGIILNLNLTKLDSKTYVEKWWHEEYYDPVKRKVVINFETDYFYKEEVQLTSQIDMVMNSTLGYEHKGFSFRISAQYQGVDLSNTLNNQETEVSQRYNDDWLRFDMAMSQKILKKMKIRFNIANLSNVGERDYIYDPMYWRNDSRYGAVYQLGFEYNF